MEVKVNTGLRDSSIWVMGLASRMFLINHTHALTSHEPALIVNQMLKPGRTAVMHRKPLDVSLKLGLRSRHFLHLDKFKPFHPNTPEAVLSSGMSLALRRLSNEQNSVLYISGNDIVCNFWKWFKIKKPR